MEVRRWPEAACGRPPPSDQSPATDPEHPSDPETDPTAAHGCLHHHFLDKEDEQQYHGMLQRCLQGADPDSWVDQFGNTIQRFGDPFPYECQLAALMDAFALWRLRADWLMPLDIDEFVFAPAAGTLARHLAALPETITSVYADCSSFGTSDLDARAPHSSVLQSHTQRAPYPKFFEDVEAIRSFHPGCAQDLTGSNWPPCKTGPGKSMIRGGAVRPSHAHMHNAFPTEGLVVGGEDLDVICNHYVFLSAQEVEGKRRAHQEAFALAGSYYNAVNDTAIHVFLPALRAMKGF